MKVKIIAWLLPVLVIGGGLKSTPVEKLNAYFGEDEQECYYWHTLHQPNPPVVSESDLNYLIHASHRQNEKARASSRDISAALFLARYQETDISSDLLLRALETLTVAEKRNPEPRLAKELSLTLASLGPEARDAMYSLRHSGDDVVANAVVSALSVYGSEVMREEMHDDISAIHEEFIKKFKAGESGMKADRFSQLSASKQLDYYFVVKERQLEDDDVINFIGESNLIKTSSTSQHLYDQDAAAHLSVNLRNVYWLSRLNKILSKTSNSRERSQIEKSFRNASSKYFPPEDISFQAKLYYLLGFELTEPEKEYLTDVLGLSEDEFLPRGEIHLAGFNLEDFQRSGEQKSVATAEPEEMITPIAEVTSEETTEKSTEVVPFYEPSEDPVEQSSNWWLWLIGAAVVVGGIGLIIRHKS